MSVWGWIFMLGAVVGISVFFFWTVWRVIRAPKDRVHGGVEIEVEDRDE
ncbi:MAG: hypothetical protein NZM04_08370 [Methylacidiphilales bacterium]|nr:hypothetical protein [Candidatus Methylacidiphilales bacterium]